MKNRLKQYIRISVWFVRKKIWKINSSGNDFKNLFYREKNFEKCIFWERNFEKCIFEEANVRNVFFGN